MKTRRFSFLALPLAAVLLALAAPLTLPQAARAQTFYLNSGDAVTVDSTGTHGTYGGQPINNTTTAYSTGPGYDVAVQTLGSAAFTLGAGGSLTATASQDAIALDAAGSGPVTITGGILTATGESGTALNAFSGPVTVEGGVFTADGYGGHALVANSTATIAGGSFSAADGLGLDATGGGTLSLFSQGDTPFLVNNVSMNNTSLAPGSSGTISGTLLDGEAFSTTFFNGSGSVFNLNVGTPPVLPAPEPSSVAALGLGALGLAGLALKARRPARLA